MGKKKKITSNFGRPREFASVADLEDAIAGYFSECDRATKWIVSKMGEAVEVPAPTPYTIEGLSEHLNIDRKTLLNYEKKQGYEDFFHTVTRAKQKVLRNLAERGLAKESDSNVTKFVMSNNFSGYTDKSSIELSKGIGRFEIIEDDREDESSEG